MVIKEYCSTSWLIFETAYGFSLIVRKLSNFVLAFKKYYICSKIISKTTMDYKMNSCCTGFLQLFFFNTKMNQGRCGAYQWKCNQTTIINNFHNSQHNNIDDTKNIENPSFLFIVLLWKNCLYSTTVDLWFVHLEVP